MQIACCNHWAHNLDKPGSVVFQSISRFLLSNLPWIACAKLACGISSRPPRCSPTVCSYRPPQACRKACSRKTTSRLAPRSSSNVTACDFAWPSNSNRALQLDFFVYCRKARSTLYRYTIYIYIYRIQKCFCVFFAKGFGFFSFFVLAKFSLCFSMVFL